MQLAGRGCWLGPLSPLYHLPRAWRVLPQAHCALTPHTSAGHRGHRGVARCRFGAHAHSTCSQGSKRLGQVWGTQERGLGHELVQRGLLPR